MKYLNKLIYTLAIIKIILPYLLQSPVYEPHRDEFLYLAEGHHMAFGFMEVPPMLSVFAWLTHLLGDGMFWIKLWPSLFGAAIFIMAAKIIVSLGGKAFAIFLAFLPFIFGAYLRLFFLFQPNPPENFFWLLMIFAIIRFVQTNNNKWLYIFGCSVGLGMLAKYSIAFYASAILLSLLLSKHRIIFINKHFWLGALVGFIIFLPNLLWQWQHGFPVIFHMNELQETQLQYISPASFLKDQLLMNLPCVFIWLSGLYFVLFSKAAKQYHFVGFTYILTIIILLVGHGKNYYALGAYHVLFAFGAYNLERFTEVKHHWLRVAFVFFPCFIGLIFLPVALPLLPPPQLAELYEKMNVKSTGTLKWEDLKDHPLPQDFADMLCWEEMAQKTAKAFNLLNNEEKKNTILFCDSYGMAGAINFYRYQYHLPEAYSDNASFLYWMPDSIKWDNLLLVTDDEQEMQHDFVKDFKTATLVDSITNPYARDYGDLIILLKGANPKMKEFFRKKIDADKKQAHSASEK